MITGPLSEHLNINLQLFAQEKTEKATQKKRQKAREKGQVLKSVEFNSAVVLLLVFFSVKLFFSNTVNQITIGFNRMYSMWGDKSFILDPQNTEQIYLIMMNICLLAVLPMAGFAIISGVTANLLQTGFLFTAESIRPKLSNLNPISGFKRMFGLRALVELVKSLIKVVIVGLVAFFTYRAEFYNFPQLLDMNIKASSMYIGDLIVTMAFKIGFCLLLLAGFDYLYQWWEFERQQKMTKQEVKDEHKQIEGDPKVKAAIKRKQQQMSMSRMMSAVPQADVVITNPTHYAVALKYDASVMAAPEVIAKGQDHVAQKIKEIAKENDIVMVENKPLAQALYKAVEIGEAVPGDLYQAVAETLAFVYKLKGKI